MIKKISSAIISLSMLFSMVQLADAAEIAGWSQNFNYGPKITAELDKSVRSGNPALHIVSQQELKAETYYQISTPVSLTGGKTYIYGAEIKANRAAGVYIQMNWEQRTRALPLGANCDWTEISKKFTPSKTGNYSLMFIVDEPGEIWLDNVFCYEYSGNQKVGGNLVKNGNFSGGVQETVVEEAPIESNAGGDLDILHEQISSSSSFSYDDWLKVVGAGNLIPAYPAENIVIDGDDSEWDDYTAVRLPTLSTQYTIFNNSSKKDAYGDFKFAYDDKYVYMTGKMYDEVYAPIVDGDSYWNRDTIQTAWGVFADGFGKEINFGMHENGELKIYNGTDDYQFKLTQSEDKKYTTYEMALPMVHLFGGKPNEDILMNVLYNDNDFDGRGIVPEWAPGIASSKSNEEFPQMRLLEKGSDLAWFDGKRIIQVNGNDPYDFYYINTSDNTKTVEISIPYIAFNEKVTVPARTGIRRDITISPDKTGTVEVKAEIKENGVVTTNVLHKINAEPNIARYNAEYFADIRAKLAEVQGLLESCKKKGIPVRYEQIDVYLMERFIPQLESIVKDSKTQITRIDNTGTTIDRLYSEAKENLTAYLDGTKEPVDAPMYVTGAAYPEGNSIMATTEWSNGKSEVRPAFFIGYGHFATAQNDVPVFNKMGANQLQMEFGISSVIKAPGGVSAWKTDSVGSYDVSYKLCDTEKKNGDYSASYDCNEKEIKANNYKRLLQSVEVEPNTTYTWGLSAKAKNATDQLWFSISGWENTKSLSGTYDWKDLSYTYTTKPDQTSIEFMIMMASPADELYIDDIFIKKGTNGKNLLKNGDFESNAPVVDDLFMVDTDAVSQIELVLKRAEENNVSVSLLLSPHYFSNYLFDTYPEIQAKASHFIGYDVMNEVARKATKLYIDAVIPIVSKYKSLTSIVLTNEPQNPAKYEQMAPWWRSWLYERYNGDIELLNSTWRTSFESFNDIPISKSVDTSQKVNLAVEWTEVELDAQTDEFGISYIQSPYSLEWNRFADEAFAEYHQFLADSVRAVNPDIPLHIKVMSHDTDTDIEISDGTNYEYFGEVSDYHGNDAWTVFKPGTSSTTLSPGSNTYHHKTVMYEQQRATKTMSVFNTEDHILYDGDKYWGYEHAKRIYADMWQGGIHGRGGSVIWLLEQSNVLTDTFYGLIHSRPDCLEAVGNANLDLNRLAYEVTAIQDADYTVGILRSKTSKNYTPAPSILNAHSAGLFAGQKVDSITDNQIADIHKYKLLILPEVTHISEENLAEIEKFASNGGKILGFGNMLLSRNEWNLPHDKARVENILKNATVYPTPDQTEKDWWYSMCDKVRDEIEKAGLMNVEVVDANTGAPVHNVEWQTAEYNGKKLVNICSFTWYETKNVKIIVNGQIVSGCKDLISGETRGETITLDEYTPQLLEIDIK